MSEVFQLLLTNSQVHPYRLVKSLRAKYISIKITATGELSVILPQGASENHAHKFLQSKRSWISKTIENIPPQGTNQQFPELIDLKLLNEKWKISYIKSKRSTTRLKEMSSNRLDVIGDMEDWYVIKKLLNQWCRKKAKNIFTEMIEILAEEHGFHFNKLTIRSQKTRWGSCSNSRNISLNSKLLFMPKSVVRYVVIHELCHTIEMNHSSRFWALVKECDNNYKDNRTTLKTLGREIIL